MLRKVEEELRTRGKVSLPSLHRHVILDGWLKPTVGQAWNSAGPSFRAREKSGHLHGGATAALLSDCWL